MRDISSPDVSRAYSASGRFLWDEEHAAFVNLPTKEEYDIAFQTLPSHRPCFSCGFEAMRTQVYKTRRLRNGFVLHNVTYHLHEFVYIRPSNPDNNLLEIGQIVDTDNGGPDDNLKIQVRYLARYDDYVCVQLDATSPQSSKTKELICDEVRHKVVYLLPLAESLASDVFT